MRVLGVLAMRGHLWGWGSAWVSFWASVEVSHDCPLGGTENPHGRWWFRSHREPILWLVSSFAKLNPGGTLLVLGCRPRGHSRPLSLGGLDLVPLGG